MIPILPQAPRRGNCREPEAGRLRRLERQQPVPGSSHPTLRAHEAGRRQSLEVARYRLRSAEPLIDAEE